MNTLAHIKGKMKSNAQWNALARSNIVPFSLKPISFYHFMILDKYGRRFVVPFVCVCYACDVRLSGQTVSMRTQIVWFRPMARPDGRPATVSLTSSHFAFNLFKKVKFICEIAVKIEFITCNWQVFVRENSKGEKPNFRHKSTEST